jgi:hypothetical protein
MRMAQTDTATKVDEAWVRSLFGGFNDPEEFFADPNGIWVDNPHYRVFAQGLEMNTSRRWSRGSAGSSTRCPTCRWRSRTSRSPVGPDVSGPRFADTSPAPSRAPRTWESSRRVGRSTSTA